MPVRFGFAALLALLMTAPLDAQMVLPQPPAPSPAALEGRQVVVVTGSTSGLGREVALAMGERGAHVVVHGRNRERGLEVAQEIQAGPGSASFYAADFGSLAQVRALGDAILRDYDRVDVLVNNAGFGVFKSISEMTIEEWQGQIDVNLGGVFYMSKAALPHLVASGDGYIINIGSLAGRNTFPGGTGYNASKFGLVGMTEAMMLDVRHDDVRVSIVMPGSVNTFFGGKEQKPERGWALEADDCAVAVMQLLDYPKEAHVSRIEMRPSQPPKR